MSTEETSRISIQKLLALRCHKYSEKVFLIDPENCREYTYNKFLCKVNKVSNFLYRLGIRKEDKVSLLMPNSPEFLFSFFGIIQLGAVACPINTHLKAEEIAFILRNSDSVALITTDDYLKNSINAVAGQEKIRHILRWTNPAVELEEIPLANIIELEEIIANEEKTLLTEILSTQYSPDDVAELIYTSGTTGKPKGAMLTHHNLIVDANWIATWNRLGEDDRAMCIMPFFHINGQVVTVMTPLYHGGSIVLPKRFSASRFFPIIVQYGVTYTGTVATMLSMILNRVNPKDISSTGKLRIIFCGSAPVPLKVQIEFEKTFKVPIIEGYGMTETSCRSTFNPLPPPEKLKLGENDGYRKIGSVGLPLGNEIKVVDENDRPLGSNEIGEIVIRGENVMKGYYENPSETEKAFKDGWFYSGDLGYYDEDGYFYIVDRKKDMVIRGGENIYPREIEEVLYEHPAVKEAACIGIPDELYGEEVMAFVALKENSQVTENDLKFFCQQQLADFKCPKKVKIIEEIPKSSSGKLLRRELKEKWVINQDFA